MKYSHLVPSGFIIFLGVIWVLQETTKVRVLRYVILFIGKIYLLLHHSRISFMFVQKLIVYFVQTHNEMETKTDHFIYQNCRCNEQPVLSLRYSFKIHPTLSIVTAILIF